jgi:hypothetical protein
MADFHLPTETKTIKRLGSACNILGDLHITTYKRKNLILILSFIISFESFSLRFSTPPPSPENMYCYFIYLSFANLQLN